MLKILSLFYQASLLFHSRRGTTLAAASSFYVIISTVPIMLLLIRLLGFFIGDLSRGSDEIFLYMEKFLPDFSPEIFEKMKVLISGPLFGAAHVTWVNLGLLLLTSLSFFNSIWNGLYLITNDRKYLSFWKNVKGVVIIGVTIGLLVISLSLPKLFIYLVQTMQNNFIVNFIWELFPPLRPMVESLQGYDISTWQFFTSLPFYFLIFLIYFTLLYRWFFSWKLPYFNSFLAALTFVISMTIGKNLFFIYFFYVRENLIRNYGDFYTLIIGLMWVYFVMCFFYFGACLSHVMRNETLFLNIRLFLSSLKTKYVDSSEN
jgi:membrane protein